MMAVTCAMDVVTPAYCGSFGGNVRGGMVLVSIWDGVEQYS